MHSNKNTQQVTPYNICSHKAWEMEDTTPVLKLDWNEATIPPSPKVFSSIQHFLKTGRVNWYPNTDNRELRDALAAYCGVGRENIQYFAGADSIHEELFRVFLEDGDKVLILGPTYDSFRAVAESFGADVHYCYLDATFSFDLDAYRDMLQTHAPKIAYICNPNNPTGLTHSLESLDAVSSKFPSTLFVIDEAYYEFQGNTAIELVRDRKNVVICRTFSKAFALASFRIGYAISSPENIADMRKILNPKNVTSLSQQAAIAALSDLPYMKHYVAEVLHAKEEFFHALETLGLTPVAGAGNFLLVPFEEELAKALVQHLEDNHIFVRVFHSIPRLRGHVRFTIGTPDQMQRVAQVIGDFLSAWDGK